MAMGIERIDLTGQVFGRLTVLGLLTVETTPATWTCQCICGVVKPLRSNSFKYNKVASCGCWNRELVSKRFRKYPKSATYTLQSWYGMLNRVVYNHPPTSEEYQNYSSRGITVCKRWRKFENFLADMGPRPEGTSIERVNNDKGYKPSNCIWATPAQQAANRRTRRDCQFLTYQGQTRPIAEWAKIKGILKGTIEGRLWRGWTDASKILETPIRSWGR